MIVVSPAIGTATLDIGMHQDNWYPWNSHGPEEEKDTREGNESELEVSFQEIK